jgi:hypothetical protein
MVSFDLNGKITQIRQSWDQGSLLKLIDVIGKTGRNWPIRDGKDQIKLIVRSVKSAGKPTAEPVQNGNELDINRARTNSQNATRDPHASLSLFAPREKAQHREPLPVVVAPRASSRPPPRDYHDLFVGNDSDGSPMSPGRAPGGRDLSESLAKSDAIAPKGGAGKNYAPSRLFDIEDAEVISPDAKINPAKFQHFDFGDGSDPHDKPTGKVHTKESKHGSQWNFDDFNTPAKVIPGKGQRANNVRHWGNEDIEEVVETPIKVKKVDKPRKDAETHFEFQDDGTPAGPRIIGRPRGAGQNNGLGLYKNNLFDEETGAPLSGDAAQPTLANVKDRKKDFDPHFTMTDDSPASKPTSHRIPETQAKVVKMMNASWDTYDQSPNQKENIPTSPITARSTQGKGPLSETTNITSNKGISIAGDGMGGKKNTPVGSDIKKDKGIAIGGDGMGGRVGSGRAWGFGDESDGEETGGINKPGKFRTGKTASKSSTAASDFWDF